MPSLDILHRPLDEVVRLIHARELSVTDLVTFSIARTKFIHDKLNVIVEDRFEDALREARAADEVLARGEAKDKPLFGIPFSVKANIGVQGMRLDMGTWSMHGQKAMQTATSVTRLQHAGAILLCTTNLSEMGLWHDTVNPIYGRTLNPWNTSRSVGGSSGGEAALLAAGGTMFGVGTDLDGSLRIPAMYCGVFAHRPSRGIVPLTGQFPFFKPEQEIPWRALDSMGPMARHASDLDLLLGIMMGPCPQDPMSMTGTLNKPPTDKRPRKIAIIENPLVRGTPRTSPEVRLAMHKARQRLIDSGAEIIDGPKDLFYNGFLLWRLLVHRAIEGRFIKKRQAKQPAQRFMELVKWATGNADHTLANCLLMISEHNLIDSDRLRTLDSDLANVRQRLDALFSKVDALVLPTSQQVAPRYPLAFMKTSQIGLTSLVNALGLPATEVPIGISSSGMPVGIQIIGRHGSDQQIIQTSDIIGEFIPSPMARGGVATRPI